MNVWHVLQEIINFCTPSEILMADERVQSADSENDGEDGVVGNLNKFVVTPVGYSGQPKKGHLIFDASFESGNLGRVDFITDYEYDLFIRPDTCNPRFRVWFNFTVENVRLDQRVIFNIVNFSKTKSLYREGMSPLVKSTSRPKWLSGGGFVEACSPSKVIQKQEAKDSSKNVYYYRCPDHCKNYVMSFAFCFDKDSDTYQFAYCYPYTYARLQGYLDVLEKRRLNFLKRELLCLSVQQKRLDMLTITNPDNLTDLSKKRVIFITARVHPGETPASFVCQGLIDFLLSPHPVAKVLRDHIIFKIVPMLNPDGVYLGNYRCSLMGFDLNRHWHEPSPWAHPTLHACKQLLLDMDSDENIHLDFYVDIHAHSTLMNGFMFGNVYEDPVRYERQGIFPKLMCTNADDFSMVNTSFNKDALKAGTGRRYLGGLLEENTMCYTLEVSFYCYQPNSSSTIIPYDEEAYMKLGRNLGKTFLDYYKMTSLIMPKPTAGPNIHQVQRTERAKGRQNKHQVRSQSELYMHYTNYDVSGDQHHSHSAQSMPSQGRKQRDIRR